MSHQDIDGKAMNTPQPLLNISKLNQLLVDIPSTLYNTTSFNAFDYWSTDNQLLHNYRMALDSVISNIVDVYSNSFNISTKYYSHVNQLFTSSNRLINDINYSIDSLQLNIEENKHKVLLVQQYKQQKYMLNIIEQAEYITYIPDALHDLLHANYILHSTYLIQHTLQILLQTNLNAIHSLCNVRDQLLTYRNQVVQQSIDKLYQSIYTNINDVSTIQDNHQLRIQQYTTIHSCVNVQRILNDAKYSPFIELNNNTRPSSTIDSTQLYSFQSLLLAEYSTDILSMQQLQNIYIQSLLYCQSIQQFISYHKRNLSNTIKQCIQQHTATLYTIDSSQRHTFIYDKLQSIIERYDYVMSIINKRVQLDDDDGSSNNITIQQCIDNELNLFISSTTINNIKSIQLNATTTATDNDSSNNAIQPSNSAGMDVMQFSFTNNALPSKIKTTNTQTLNDSI